MSNEFRTPQAEKREPVKEPQHAEVDQSTAEAQSAPQQESETPKTRKGILRVLVALFVKLGLAVAHAPYAKIWNTILHNGSRFMHWVTFRVFLPKRMRNISKEEVFTIIFHSDTPKGKKFDIWLLVLIFLNVVVMVLDSYQAVTGVLSKVLVGLEWVFTVVFTIEFYLRVWCLKHKRKYVLSFYGIIDILSVFPSYLAIFFPSAQVLSVLRILRALRIFRILRMHQFVDEGAFLLYALRKSVTKVLIFMIFVLFSAVITGTLMYTVECNQEGTQFTSIPKGIYWAVVTLTTVGYGDMAPETSTGQFIAVLMMLMAYAVIAVPTGIVAGSTFEAFKEQRERENAALGHDADEDFNDDDDPTDVDMFIAEVEAKGYDEDMEDFKDGENVAPRKRLYCAHCGHEEEDLTATYCKHCGSRLTKDRSRSWISDFFKS